MRLILSFDKGKRRFLGVLIKDATMFDHSADKIISISVGYSYSGFPK